MSLVFGQNERVADWMQARMVIKYVARTAFETIGLERNGQLAAGAIFEDCDGVDIKAGIAIDGWMSKAFLRAIFRYPFVQLECDRITCQIAGKNRKARTLVEKLGFKNEGVKRQAIADDDMIYYGMLKSECRYV